MKEKFWMIVSLVSISSTRESEFDSHGDDYRISKSTAPTYIHTNRDRAEAELLRLSASTTEGPFVLLESVANVTQAVAVRTIKETVFKVEPIPAL